jgi:bisphosphoglycerate-dependent phosphoglycerate mutase
MKLYVIRHGRTKCNDENKYNGKLNEDINEIEVEQAKKARGIYFYFNEIPKDGMLQKFGSSNCEIKEYEI